ncbi:MAG: glycosyltransferase family 9 protein [Magnetococcus sp. YQC-9]
MNTARLRFLDYWIGRPLCHLATVWSRLRRPFHPRKDPATAGSVLFIKLMGIGSIVLTLPTLLALKRHHPEMRIYFLTFSSNAQFLHLLNICTADHIIPVETHSVWLLFRSAFQALRKIRAEKIDLVIDLEFFSRFTALFAFLATPKTGIIGYHGFHCEGLKRGDLIDHPIDFNCTLHTSQTFFTLLRPLGITQESYDSTLPQIPPSPGATERFRAWLNQAGFPTDRTAPSGWIAVNPHCGDLIQLRKWPLKHFAHLIHILLDRHPEFGIVLIGSGQERANGEHLRSMLETKILDRVFNLAGMTDIQGLLDLFHSTLCVVSNDSGPAHLAAMTGVPSVVLFGPEIPELYRPLGENVEVLRLRLDCQPCVSVYNGKRSWCHKNRCLSDLSPTIVVEAVERACLKKSQ